MPKSIDTARFCLFRLQLQNLHRLGQNQLAVHALLGNIADHAIAGKKLVELLEAARAAVPML